MSNLFRLPFLNSSQAWKRFSIEIKLEYESVIFNLKPCPPPQDFTLDIPIFAKLYDFYKNLSQHILGFPRAKRYTLGQKLDQLTTDSIELVIMAGYIARDQKLPLLKKVSIKLDLIKILLRLAWETKCIDNNKYQSLAAQILEIGKMLGGWDRKSVV